MNQFTPELVRNVAQASEHIKASWRGRRSAVRRLDALRAGGVTLALR